MRLVGVLLGVAAVTVLPIALTELTEVSPWLAERVVRRAARRLPAGHQVRYLDEWLAELDSVPGKLTKLVWALRLNLGAMAVAHELLDVPLPARYQRLVRSGRLPLWVYLPLMVVFVVAELILNSTALQIIGESDLAVLILAGALSVAMLVICHYVGEALREAEEDPRGRRRVWWLVAAAVQILAFLWAIGAMRMQFLQRIGIHGDLVGAYLLQLPVIAGAVIAAYLYHQARSRVGPGTRGRRSTSPSPWHQ